MKKILLVFSLLFTLLFCLTSCNEQNIESNEEQVLFTEKDATLKLNDEKDYVAIMEIYNIAKNAKTRFYAVELVQYKYYFRIVAYDTNYNLCEMIFSNSNFGYAYSLEGNMINYI